MYKPFMCGLCPLTGCLYNVDCECMYNYMTVQDPYSCACYDETDAIYDELMMEEW